jgi:hypothetical protein
VVAALIPSGVVTAPAIRVDRRQEGGRGARLHSRRDMDGGGSEKGHNSDGNAFYQRGGGVEEGGGRWEAATAARSQCARAVARGRAR